MTKIKLGRRAQIILLDRLTNEELIIPEDTTMMFNGVKSTDRYANLMELSIYNASDEQVDFTKRDDVRVTLQAAMTKEDFKDFFIGDLVKRQPTPEDSDDDMLILSIGDAEKTINGTFLRKPYKGETTQSEVITDCLRALGVDFHTPALAVFTEKYSSGFVPYDKAINILADTINPDRYDWSIQNETFILTDKTESLVDSGLVLDESNVLFDPEEVAGEGYKITVVLEHLIST